MSERPNDPGLTSGDPLAPGPEGPRHESGLPGFSGGYSSPPPPGAFGTPAPTAPAPAPAAGRYVLAGWWSRVGAALIDGIIISVVAVALLAIFGVGIASTDSDTGTGALIVATLVSGLAFAVAALLYAPLMMAKTNGKTLGRMAVGNRVVRANGQPMTFGWAMLREVAVKWLLFNAVGGSITFGLAGLVDVLWPLWDDENRALHDFIVDTRTIKD
jgi:uncharacterized RDD family membrane protein YckC